MKIFVDSANLVEIGRAIQLGATGVTTNPTSAAMAGIPYRDLIERIATSFKTLESVSAQVTATNPVRMYEQAIEYNNVSAEARVIVKVPATINGIGICRDITSKWNHVRFNVTLVFTPMQAVLAAQAGAYIVSPFLARTDDAKGPGAGYTLLRNIRGAFDRHKFSTKILAASIRSAEYVQQALIAGADICTMSLSVLESLYKNEQTEAGLAKMMSDWNAAQQGEAAPKQDWTMQTR